MLLNAPSPDDNSFLFVAADVAKISDVLPSNNFGRSFSKWMSLPKITLASDGVFCTLSCKLGKILRRIGKKENNFASLFFKPVAFVKTLHQIQELSSLQAIRTITEMILTVFLPLTFLMDIKSVLFSIHSS